jgi:hypothetical protein
VPAVRPFRVVRSDRSCDTSDAKLMNNLPPAHANNYTNWSPAQFILPKMPGMGLKESSPRRNKTLGGFAWGSTNF